MIKIVILGRKQQTGNYVKFLNSLPAEVITTLSPGELAGCKGLVLPGGNDITPAFFGERNNGSRTIDTELDILQLQALNYALRRRLPVLGICKGMQIINVALGGTIVQDMPRDTVHSRLEEDVYHDTVIQEGSCLCRLYGKEARVNSAHHQKINRLGSHLQIIQWCSADGCPEAIVHESLPILGVQWHPERLDPEQTSLSGALLLSLFSSWICAFDASSSQVP